MATATKKKTSRKKSKVITLSGEEIRTDAERISALVERMTPQDRENYQSYCDGIQICKDTQKTTALDGLIKGKERIESKYETGDDERVCITWDDAALKEAQGA